VVSEICEQSERQTDRQTDSSQYFTVHTVPGTKYTEPAAMQCVSLCAWELIENSYIFLTHDSSVSNIGAPRE